LTEQRNKAKGMDGAGRIQRLDWRKRASIAVHIAHALAFLHDTGLNRCNLGAAVHRDVKTENVLMDDGRELGSGQGKHTLPPSLFSAAFSLS
jgi:serine/threonine protein kinase